MAHNLTQHTNKNRIHSSKRVKTNKPNSKIVKDEDFVPFNTKMNYQTSNLSHTSLIYGNDIQSSQQNRNKRSLDGDSFDDVDNLLNDNCGFGGKRIHLAIKTLIAIDNDENGPNYFRNADVIHEVDNDKTNLIDAEVQEEDKDFEALLMALSKTI